MLHVEPLDQFLAFVGSSSTSCGASIPLKSHPIRDSSPLTSCSRHRIEVDMIVHDLYAWVRV